MKQLKEIKKRYGRIIEILNCGKLKKSVQKFIANHIKDLKKEEEYIQMQIVSRVKNYCRQLGSNSGPTYRTPESLNPPLPSQIFRFATS